MTTPALSFALLRRSLALAMLAALSATHSAAEPNKPDKPIRIFAYGDSLTAGYHLPPDAAFPTQLQMALRKKGYKVEIYNAGVSGDTTSAGLRRIDWSLAAGGDAVILELGANDVLRGQPPQLTHDNLDKMIQRFRDKHMEVLLTGMKAPSNWGKSYQGWFDSIFPELAKKHDTLFYPFFLEGVALQRDLMLKDGIHPNQKGVNEIVKRILPAVEKLIARVKKKKKKKAETTQ